MTILYTNENNPAALKIIIAKTLAKKDVEVKIVTIHDRLLHQPKHLPSLEISDDESFFMPNLALWYLLPPSDATESKVTEWLEWESTILTPNISFVLGSPLKNEKVRETLILTLNKFNKYLENKKFVVDNSLTICDIAIWATLYPLYVENTFAVENKLDNIISWVKGLLNEKAFKESIDIYKLDGGHSSYSSLFHGGKFLVSHLNEATASKNTTAPTSPQHQVETVSEEEVKAAEAAWKKTRADLPKLKEGKGVVLPVAGEKNIFITSALPYVNNVPHLGNIIGCVLSADVFARYSRLCNYNTLFICGTDEYGTATETKALEEGLSCQAICDKYHKIHKDTYDWFNISFNYFGRTSTPEQKDLCQDLFLKLNDNGFMFTQSVEQLHCEKCNRFLADRFVEGGCPNLGCTYEDARGDQCDGCGKLVNATELKNPRCKICSNTPKLKSSNQFFIDLPKLEPLLHHWMKKSSSGWSHNAEVIGKAWLKEGLKPRCITRDLKWGVPVPLDGFRDKVFYVWFDAPIGYMSISKAYTKDYEKWWIPGKNTEITLYQFMAKDNVPFHSVLFPSMLLGANRGYVTVSHLMATEYLNYEDGKFSKSRGVGVFGTDAQKTGIPSDVWRFYLLYVRPESQDSSFSWDDLATKNNSELLNNLGNFINRALVFAKNNFGSTIPPMKPTKEDFTLLALCTKEVKQYVAALEKSKLRDGIRHILAISRHGNQYMQSNQPWVLLKGNSDQKIRAGTIIGICSNLACLLATLLQPYMPDTSANLKKQLNTTDHVINPENVEIVTLLPAGHKLGEPSPLFAKIELEKVQEYRKLFGGSQSNSPNKVEQPTPTNLTELQSLVTEQANKVRTLKSSGVEKAVWQPEVAILLDLKKKLEALSVNGTVEAKPPTTDSAQIKRLEDEVAKQGLVVRKLKESKADKSVWQPEVDKLLALKNQLAVASGVPIAAPQKGKKGKSK